MDPTLPLPALRGHPRASRVGVPVRVDSLFSTVLVKNRSPWFSGSGTPQPGEISPRVLLVRRRVVARDAH